MRKLDVRSKKTNIVLEPKTRLALVQMCKADGITASETMRNLIRTEAAKRGLWSYSQSLEGAVDQMMMVPSQCAQGQGAR
jgi:hypothetical protein